MPPEELADHANPKASVELRLGPIQLDGQTAPMEPLLLRLTPNQLLRYVLDGAELLLQQLPEVESTPLEARKRALSLEEIRNRQRAGGVSEDLLRRVIDGLRAYPLRPA
ncbi:hypothetical protein CYQ11_19595 [Streptomyces cinnamoneus]|nr:hypothetical protein CYQ11_19595 [Streptomyces cinnamoneus]